MNDNKCEFAASDGEYENLNEFEISNEIKNLDEYDNSNKFENLKGSLNKNASKIDKQIQVQIEIDPMTIQAFTDGSCKNNGKKEAVGGFAVIFVGGVLKGKKLKGKIKKNASNIRAEGKALICVLERLQKIEKTLWKKTQIYSDSEFWINMILKFMPKWSEDKFDKQKNPDITKKLWKLWNAFPDHILEIIWVPAHNKLNWANSESEYEKWCFKHNDAVDKLANKTYLE